MNILAKINGERRWLAKFLAVGIYFSAILAVVFSDIAVTNPPFEAGTQRYTFQNLSVAFIIVTFVFGIMLKQLQRNVYSLFGKHASLDERQQAVRSKIYERSYVVIIVLVFFSGFFLDRQTTHAQGVATWLLISAIVNLPAMLAVFQKNS